MNTSPHWINIAPLLPDYADGNGEDVFETEAKTFRVVVLKFRD